MKKTSISTAVLAALLATVALAGCKKKEETVDNNAQPAAPVATTPVEPAAPQPMTAAAPVNVSGVTVARPPQPTRPSRQQHCLLRKT